MQNSISETTKTIKKSNIDLQKTSNHELWTEIVYFDIFEDLKNNGFFKYVPLYFVCIQKMNNFTELK